MTQVDSIAKVLFNIKSLMEKTLYSIIIKEIIVLVDGLCKTETTELKKDTELKARTSNSKKRNKKLKEQKW